MILEFFNRSQARYLLKTETLIFLQRTYVCVTFIYVCANFEFKQNFNVFNMSPFRTELMTWDKCLFVITYDETRKAPW